MTPETLYANQPRASDVQSLPECTARLAQMLPSIACAGHVKDCTWGYLALIKGKAPLHASSDQGEIPFARATTGGMDFIVQLLAQCILSSRIVVCLLIFNKRLEVTIPRIGPIVVSCHSSSDSCR